MEYDFSAVGGLNDWARSRLALESASVVREESGDVFEDSAGTQIPLYKYILCDGRVYVEKAQDQCLVEPITFLKLVDLNGNEVFESLWSEEGIRNFKEKIIDI